MKSEKNRTVNSWISLAVGIGLLVALTGCGASPKEPPAPPPPPVDEDLLALAPEGADAALWVDMQAFRKSKLFKSINTFFGDEAIPFWGRTEAVNPITESDEILFVFANGLNREPDQLLILIKGHFASADIMDHAASLPGAVKGTLGSVGVVRTEKTTMLAPTGRTVAVGNEGILRKVIGLSSRVGKSLRENPAFEDLSLNQTRAIQFRYKMGEVVPDLESLGGGRPFIDVESVMHMDAEVHLAEGVDVSLAMIAPTQMAASKMAREIKRTRKKLGKNMFVMLLGMDWFLNKIEVSTEKAKTTVSVSLSDADLDEILKLSERLAKIRELAGGAAQETGLPNGALSPTDSPKPKE